MDEAEHRHYTGVSNQRILENLEFIASSGQHLVVRVPLIPGITANRENIDEGIQKVGDFLNSNSNVVGVF